MKVLMILGGIFPPDIRVEKEASALIRQGHEVHLLCVRGKDHESSCETVQGIAVYRLDTPKGIISKWNGGYRKLSFIDLVWGKRILKLAKESAIDAIHVHDLPLVRTGLYCARRLEIPVIADLHENYPVSLEFWVLHWTLRDRIFNSPRRWRRHEKQVLKQVDRIIVVVHEAKERLVRECGIEQDKISVVSNTVDLASLQDMKKIQPSDESKKRFIISYAGGFGSHRGIDTAVAAMKKVTARVPTTRLLLVGGRGELAEKIDKQINSEGMNDYIQIVGWVSQEKALQYMADCDVGLIPHKRNDHTDNTIPHKLFQYMGLGKPVLVSDCLPLKRIIVEYQCGLVFEAGNCEALAEGIISLHQNESNYGENGKRAVRDKYNWERDSKTLLTLYSYLSSRGVF